MPEKKQFEKIIFNPLYEGKNPKGVKFEIDQFEHRELFNEIDVSAFKELGGREVCIANIIIGINDNGEVRIISTDGADGDNDKHIAIYPERPEGQSVDECW